MNTKLFVVKSKDNQYVLISDLYIATYLICCGIKVISIKKSINLPQKAYFMFSIENLKQIVDGIKNFFSGKGMVHANSFSTELKKQKSLIRGVVEGFDKDFVEEGNKIMITEKGIFEVQEEK